MSLWDKTEFDAIAASTRLSDRTIKACAEVLVNGKSGVEAAELHEIFPAAISRGLKTLRERHAELQKQAEIRKDTKDTLKTAVVQSTREMVGDQFVIRDADMGQEYEGVGILKKDGFLVQKVGIGGVIHDLGRLMKVPQEGAYLKISYPKSGGLAEVEERNEIEHNTATRSIER